MRCGIDLAGLSFLVVDDSAFMRNAIRTVLGELGSARVAEAADGTEAFDQIAWEEPDIVICDWVMRPMGGEEFMRRLRGDPRSPIATLPVIMLTSFSGREHALTAARLGVNEFIEKPLTPGALARRIEHRVQLRIRRAHVRLERPHRPSAPASVVVVTKIPSDLEQPPPQVRTIPIRLEMSQQTHERFLNDVLGIRLLAKRHGRETEKRWSVCFVELEHPSARLRRVTFDRHRVDYVLHGSMKLVPWRHRSGHPCLVSTENGLTHFHIMRSIVAAHESPVAWSRPPLRSSKVPQ